VGYTSVSEILEDLPDAAPPAPTCVHHITLTAVSCCRVCGRPLCRDCAPADAVTAECRSCHRPLRGRLLRFGSLLTPSLPGLWALIGLLLIAYVVLTAHRFSVFAVREPKGFTERTRRSSLFLTQAARSDHYGQALEKEGRRDLARRRFVLALDATRRVLEDVEQTEYWKDLSGDQQLETESELHIALATYLLRDGKPDEAKEELSRVIELKPPPPILRLAHFRMGEALESQSPAEAIGSYRESQAENNGSPAPFGDADRIIDAASLNPATRSFYLTVRRMAGRFDPAEAQVRIIACHERLGERLQAEVAYGLLLEHYPHSEQAQALRKTRGEPKAGNAPSPVRPQPVPDDKADEEKITIVPLER
jgi:tetratricopeptide (TPR) repeat protein